MNRHDNSEDLLEQATRAMRDVPPFGDVPEELLLQSIAASRDAAARQPHWIFQRIKAMKPLSKIAASILVALSLGAVAWALLHASPALAFATVVQQLHDAQTMTADVIIQQQGMTIREKIMYRAPGHFRIEAAGAAPEAIDLQTGRIVVLDDMHKTAIVLQIDQKDAANNTAVASVDWIEKLRNISKNAGKPLGEADVDGVRARQFSVQENGQQWTIFADATTGAPLRIESIMKLGEQVMTIALDHIALGQPLAISLFSTDVPAGYTQEQANVTGAAIGEADLLKFFEDYSDNTGIFPPSLRDFKRNTGIGAKWSPKKPAPGEPMALPSADFMKSVVQATRTMMFINQLPASADWHYAGAGLKKGDASKAIFWYHVKDVGAYRVIYGDLHTAEVAAADAPQVPNAETGDTGK